MRYFSFLIVFLGCAVISLTGCQSLDSGGGSLLGGNASEGSGSSNDPYLSEEFDTFGDPRPGRLMWRDLSPSRINTTLQARLGGSDQQKAEQYFLDAKSVYDQGSVRWKSGDRTEATIEMFRQAAANFELAASAWPNSALEQDALFMQGEASFFANDYVAANRAYEILLDKYSGTRQLDLVEARRFEIAQYWLALQRNGEGIALNNSSRPNTGLQKEARRILHRIRLDDPTGKLADDATLALGNAFFEAQQFSDAADAYEDLRQNFPGSAHQFHAHLFELKARLHAYRGPNYDGTDLEKAEKLMRTLVSQYPKEVEAEREFLAVEGTRIREKLAERDLTLAKYYAGRGENRAARFYYAQVADGYDDTSLANQAQEQIASLGGLPDLPPQRAPWLAAMFPLKERNKPLLNSTDEPILR